MSLYEGRAARFAPYFLAQAISFFHMPSLVSQSVRNAPGLFCQGCARSVPLLQYPSPPPLPSSRTINLPTVYRREPSF